MKVKSLLSLSLSCSDHFSGLVFLRGSGKDKFRLGLLSLRRRLTSVQVVQLIGQLPVEFLWLDDATAKDQLRQESLVSDMLVYVVVCGSPDNVLTIPVTMLRYECFMFMNHAGYSQ